MRLKKSVLSINDIRSQTLGRRLELGLSQTEVAKRAQVSRKWISSFEQGSPKAELELVLRLITSLGLILEISQGKEDSEREIGADSHLTVTAKITAGAKVTKKLPQIDLNEVLGRYK